jgi:hypothetical protein
MRPVSFLLTLSILAVPARAEPLQIRGTNQLRPPVMHPHAVSGREVLKSAAALLRLAHSAVVPFA